MTDDRQQRLIEQIDRNGDFITGDDGYKHFAPTGRGYLTASDLRVIADELDKRNAAWDAIIQESAKD